MRKNEIEKLIIECQRRLQKRKEQKAKLGINTPPEVLTEIEDIEEEIENFKQSLEALKKNQIHDGIGGNSSGPDKSTISKHRVQIYLQGDFSSLSLERKFAAIDAFAAIVGVSPEAIEVFRIFEGSIVFDLGIPEDSVEPLRSLLQSNNAELRLLKIEKILLEKEGGELEEWSIVDGKFELLPSTQAKRDEVSKKGQESWLWKLYLGALDAFRRENWRDANRYFTQLLQEDNSFTYASQLLDKSRRQLELRDLYERAKIAYNNAEFSEAMHLLHDILAKDLNYQGAPVLLQKWKREEEVRRLYAIGLAQYDNEDWAEAVDTFKAIVKISGYGYLNSSLLLEKAQQEDELSNLYHQGQAYLYQKKWEEAVQIFRLILTIRQDYYDANVQLSKAERQSLLSNLYQLGLDDLNQGNWTGAIDNFHKIVELDPDYLDAVEYLHISQLYQAATELRNIGKVEEALKLFREAEKKRKSKSGND